MFFACEGVKHRVIHGPNPPKSVWAASDYIHTCDGTSKAQYSEPSFLAKLGAIKRRSPDNAEVTDERPLDERMMEVSSVASAMQDLDTQLNSWLSRLRPS